MNTLKQESKVETIALVGEVDGADVRLNYSRENGKLIRQITAHATKQDENGGNQMSVFIDYQMAGKSVNINVHGCGLDNFPSALIEGLLLEMITVNSES